MLTDDMRREGWLPWDGGDCPVEPLSKPGIIIRGFARWHLCQMPSGPEGAEAQSYDWRHTSTPACDIIAYKPENPNGQ